MTDAPHDPNRLRLLVLTPEEILFEGDVLWAQVPLIDGLTGIWPGHAPLVGRIDRGTVEYATPDGIEAVSVAGGVLRVDEGRCIVLVSALVQGEPGGWSTDGPDAAVEESDADLEALIESALSDDALRELQGG